MHVLQRFAFFFRLIIGQAVNVSAVCEDELPVHVKFACQNITVGAQST